MTTAGAVAHDGIVILKNSGNLLPLQKLKSIAIIGSDAVVYTRKVSILMWTLVAMRELWSRDGAREVQLYL